MSIQSLPSRTVKLLGSSQIITDPTSLIKELVDNALDAKATSISVEISSDALAIIQVRDNGIGIAPGDRPLVARPHHTSKLRDFVDLKAIGGISLGFRGEALASMAEVCDSFVVTTKVECEATAAVLTYTTNGELQHAEKASCPVGTIVRITNLFHTLPVRKQIALKSASTNLSKIKKMLTSYALIRYSVRFSLKILGSTTADRRSWIYAPKAQASINDAVCKIIGQGCVSQCEFSVLSHEGFEIQAFMPKASAKLSKINNLGQYLAIDHRPMSTSKGFLKQLISAFKMRLQAAASGFADEQAKDPFAWIKISCPAGSYDPNVEPAKDDVIFEDSGKVMEIFGLMLDRFYSPAPAMSEMIPDCDLLQNLQSSPQKVNEDIATVTDVTRTTKMNSTKCNARSNHKRSASQSDIAEDEPKVGAVADRRLDVSQKIRFTANNGYEALATHQNGVHLNDMSKSLINPSHSLQVDSETSLPRKTKAQPNPPWAIPSPEPSSSPLSRRTAARMTVDGDPRQSNQSKHIEVTSTRALGQDKSFPKHFPTEMNSSPPNSIAMHTQGKQNAKSGIFISARKVLQKQLESPPTSPLSERHSTDGSHRNNYINKVNATDFAVPLQCAYNKANISVQQPQPSQTRHPINIPKPRPRLDNSVFKQIPPRSSKPAADSSDTDIRAYFGDRAAPSAPSTNSSYDTNPRTAQLHNNARKHTKTTHPDKQPTINPLQATSQAPQNPAEILPTGEPISNTIQTIQTSYSNIQTSSHNLQNIQLQPFNFTGQILPAISGLFPDCLPFDALLPEFLERDDGEQQSPTPTSSSLTHPLPNMAELQQWRSKILTYARSMQTQKNWQDKMDIETAISRLCESD